MTHSVLIPSILETMTLTTKGNFSLLLVHNTLHLSLFIFSLLSLTKSALLLLYSHLGTDFPPSLLNTMSRHNRRRTRAGHKVSTSGHYEAFELLSFADTSESKPLTARYPRRSDLAAQHWRNGYLAWQSRERKQKVEYEKLREERNRIFGGDGNDGEGDGLCSRMMDYFVRLDYLEG